MRLVVVLIWVGAVGMLVYVLLAAWLAGRARRGGPWRVDTIAVSDAVLAVVLTRDGGEQVVTVRELPATMAAYELAGELRMAREDAELQAEELNRGCGHTREHPNRGT